MSQILPVYTREGVRFTVLRPSICPRITQSVALGHTRPHNDPGHPLKSMTDLCRYCYRDTPVSRCMDPAHIRIRIPEPVSDPPTTAPSVTLAEKRSMQSAQARKWKMENPERHKNSARRNRLWVLYRLTPEDYDRILEHQGGVCGITGRIPASKRLAVDHDHEIGLIRGLLSFTANKGLSYFNDDPALLRAAADYLENPPAVAAIGPHYGLLGKAQRKKKMIYGGVQ